MREAPGGLKSSEMYILSTDYQPMCYRVGRPMSCYITPQPITVISGFLGAPLMFMSIPLSATNSHPNPLNVCLSDMMIILKAEDAMTGVLRK